MANTFIFDDDEQPDMGSPVPDQDDDEVAPEEGEGNNRTFILLLIGIGGFALIAILCIAGYFFMSRPGGLFYRPDAAALAATAAADAVIQETQNALLASPTFEPTLTLAETPTPTPTSVVVVFASETPIGGIDPATATFEALQTQLAGAQLTATAEAGAGVTGTAIGGTRTATATARIPNTGFADEFGLPGLVIVTIILLGVILLARRLRETPA